MSPIGVYDRTTSARRVYTVRPLEDRFWAFVVKGPGCWTWTGATSAGYGRIREGRAGTRYIGAHRVSWELANGPIPDGLFVCHKCDNPPCVRPDHLFLGTAADNVADMIAKGRGRKPARVGGYPQTVAAGRPRRTKSYPVTGAVRWAIIHRDGGCTLARLFFDHQCRDQWGETHSPYDQRKLTIEHIKDELMMGRRAPSDVRHLVALCAGANFGVPSKEERAAMRDYLVAVNA